MRFEHIDLFRRHMQTYCFKTQMYKLTFKVFLNITLLRHFHTHYAQFGFITECITISETRKLIRNTIADSRLRRLSALCSSKQLYQEIFPTTNRLFTMILSIDVSKLSIKPINVSKSCITNRIDWLSERSKDTFFR